MDFSVLIPLLTFQELSNAPFEALPRRRFRRLRSS